MLKLNARQKSFCEFYVASGNATESAIKAGYKEKYAGVNADKLLKNTNSEKAVRGRGRVNVFPFLRARKILFIRARGRVMLTKYPAAFPVGQLVSQILTKYTLRYPECGLPCGSDAPASG